MLTRHRWNYLIGVSHKMHPTGANQKTVWPKTIIFVDSIEYIFTSLGCNLLISVVFVPLCFCEM